ncbi:thiol peroxidase [Reichenbachiella versicolor]|uniref:thiol peroxidase n=1 Tax=Reichenbachiella versicolor TaxID=1821036 RepID=UPI000D6E2F83|nr:thiol peroxidase [Reichenbachiella versicolor]
MAKITLKGNEINTIGELPEVGSTAPEFEMVKGDLSRAKLSDFSGKLVLNIFPSVDTSTCATSVRKFNEVASSVENTTVLCISKDLPFAQSRFCGAEGIENVVMLSDYVDGTFGKTYGLRIVDGPLEGLDSRSIVVLDEDKKVIYTEQVSETVDEPDYDKALESLK